MRRGERTVRDGILVVGLEMMGWIGYWYVLF